MDSGDQHDEFLPDLGQDQDQEELFEHHRIVVDRFQSLLRIDKFLMNRLQNVSRNRIQGATDAGTILVNGKSVKSSYKVKPGDVITVVLAHPPREIELYPDEIPLDIRYEDDQLYVVNKQAGLVVHPAYGHYRETLVNGIVHLMHPELKGQPLTSDSIRPGLVHRIDKDTTGLIVIAKNEQALSHLAKQFFDRTIDRHYLALVWGDFSDDSGTVSVHIGRSPVDRKVMEAFPDASQGKHAITHWEVLERFGYVTLIRCKLETGRTHQIRIHMKYIGHPLFGDKTYGGDRILKGTVFSKYRQFIDNCFEILPRQALHARSIGFRHPSDGRTVYLEAELPDDILAILEKWRGYVSAAKNEA